VFNEEVVNSIRARFPRAEQDASGRRRAFLDNGTGTLVLGRAAKAETHARINYSANVGGIFNESKGADEIILDGRKAVADVLNAPSPNTIISGESATNLFFSLSYAIGKELSGKENAVITNYEHYSNLSPWLELERRGLLKESRFSSLNKEDGTLDIDHVGSLIDENTQVITVSAASNVLGTKTPLDKIRKMAHDVGAYFIVDAVHHIAHGYMDVKALNCDFLVFSGYKFFSAHGSFMYGKQDLLEDLTPYKVKPAPDHPPHNWEWGTRDQAKFAAIKGVVEHHQWLADKVKDESIDQFNQQSGRVRALKIAINAVEEYEKRISTIMLTGFEDTPGLNQMPHVKVYGLTDPERVEERDPTFSFNVKGTSNNDVVERLWSKHAIAIRAEDFYSRIHEVYEKPTLIRASFVQYNTLEEAVRLLKALELMSP
jgi:selenocysteine lyase/cysteine desulfurase